MTYRRRGRRRNNPNFGGMVGDVGGIANAFGPRGALIAGLLGFAFFYWAVPWALESWLAYNQARLSPDATGQLASKLLRDIFGRRFIRPSQWAGIAVLLLCIGIAVWKAFAGGRLNRQDERNSGRLARLVARFLD